MLTCSRMRHAFSRAPARGAIRFVA
jgi:hypothetical protein